MIFTTVAHFVWCFLPLVTGTVLVPRPIPHLGEGHHVHNRFEGRGVKNVTATTTTSTPSTITPAPTSGWPTYSRMWPSPGCEKYTGTTSYSYEWCRVAVGTVQLHFWPTSNSSLKYPSTYYMSEYDVTMTRPSIYYVVDSVWATDVCHQTLGPVQTNFVYSLDLWNVSTLQPFANAQAATRIGDPQQLVLNDLHDRCPIIAPSNIPKNNHNTVVDSCNPVLEYTNDLKYAVANHAWNHCGKHAGGDFGIWDPPVPISACTGEDCGDVPEPTTTTSSSLIPTAQPVEDQQTSTTSVASAEPAPTAVAPIASPTTTSVEASSPTTPAEPNKEKPTVGTAPIEPVTSTPVVNEPLPKIPGVVSTSYNSPEAPATRSAETNSAIATLSNSVIISAVGSQVQVGSQTIGAGSSAITISGGAVVSIEPSGKVVVSDSDSGFITTYSVAAGEAIPTVPAQSVTVSAIGSSAVVIGGQTVSLGGSAVTLSGAQVASLGSSGIVLQAPSGIETTLSVPSSTNVAVVVVPGKTTASIPESHQSLAISALGSSAVVIAGQTLSIAGSVATLSGGRVASLGSSGIVLQAPSGIVTTLSVPSSTDVVVVPVPAVNTLSLTSTVAASLDIPPTSSTSGYVAATGTGLGSIIYSTFEGDGRKSTDVGILGILCCVGFGALVVAL